jgi:hypothetical protein
MAGRGPGASVFRMVLGDCQSPSPRSDSSGGKFARRSRLGGPELPPALSHLCVVSLSSALCSRSGCGLPRAGPGGLPGRVARAMVQVTRGVPSGVLATPISSGPHDWIDLTWHPLPRNVTTCPSEQDAGKPESLSVTVIYPSAFPPT